MFSFLFFFLPVNLLSLKSIIVFVHASEHIFELYFVDFLHLSGLLLVSRLVDKVLY